MDERTLFETFLHDMAADRYEACEAVLADEIRWHLPPFAGTPPFEGKKAVMSFLNEGAGEIYQAGSMSIEPHQILVADGQASCHATLRATTRRGMPYENMYAFFARLADGKLVEVWVLMDSANFQNQLRARPADDSRADSNGES